MTIRSSLLLTTILGSAILLSACSGDENLQLGSRDDIVIMKNGVPVNEQNIEPPTIPDVAASNDIVAPQIPETATAEVIEKAEKNIATPVAEMKAEVQKDMQVKAVETIAEPIKEVVSLAEEKAIEPVTEITMSNSVAAEAQAAKMGMKATKPFNTERISGEKIEESVDSVKEVLNPMATTPMKSNGADTERVEAVAEEEAPEVAPQKVEGGCYRNMLVATTKAMPVMEERRIICAKDLTPSVVAIVQQALINHDYNIGEPDGKMGNKTLNALEAFQRKNGLAVGGLTFEALDKLNITL